jgi:hypothetical protein
MTVLVKSQLENLRNRIIGLSTYLDKCLVGNFAANFFSNFLNACELYSFELLKPTWPGDGHDDYNRNDYYLGDPWLNRNFSRTEIAIKVEAKLSVDVVPIGLIIL